MAPNRMEQPYPKSSLSDVSMSSLTGNESRKSPTISTRTYSISPNSRSHLLTEEGQYLDSEFSYDDDSVSDTPIKVHRTPSDLSMKSEDPVGHDEADDTDWRPQTVHAYPPVPTNSRFPLLPTSSNIVAAQNNAELSPLKSNKTRKIQEPMALCESDKRKRSEIILMNLRRHGIVLDITDINPIREQQELRMIPGDRKPLPPVPSCDPNKENGKVTENRSFGTPDDIKTRASKISEQAQQAQQKRERIIERIMENKSNIAPSIPSEKVGKTIKMEEKKQRRKATAQAKSQKDTEKRTSVTNKNKSHGKVASAKRVKSSKVRKGKKAEKHQ